MRKWKIVPGLKQGRRDHIGELGDRLGRENPGGGICDLSGSNALPHTIYRI